ncbi:MAG: class I SAM-dependent methyltransferase [Paracoccaceae bacterium]|nr:class I SAM-dependent methyltransferase [Paracoccaceae bacterium]MDG1736537.1 class I SAM-dependent methyltransferase [Paracoccaceae bacterium]MDG2259021.1 class I SAM-dependent methyltransferase [Paracoccaceae bacterium]
MTKARYPQARIWNRFAAGYAKSPVDDLNAYQVKLDKTAALMTPDMSVLEIGCGTGTTALYHAERISRIDALDFSSEMIGFAQGKAAEGNSPNVAFHISTLADWEIENGPYDMVMAHSILHLVDDLDETLRQIHLRLKPGGWFVSSTVCIRDRSWLLSKLLPLVSATRLIPRVLPLSSKGLQDRIPSAGFNISEVWRPAAGKAVFIIAQAA